MYSDKITKILSSKKISFGDRVSVSGKESVEGVLMPRHEFGDPNCIVVKRDDGYNMGVFVGPETRISLVSRKETKHAQKPKIVHSSKAKPVISILHTGGTIASRVDYKTGGVVSAFSPEEILEMYPELREIAKIESSLLMNIFSEDMTFKDYAEIAKAVTGEIKKGADGIIITHGTDTLHYTSCALSFMLENLPVPVILVGAQRSSDRGSSDAFMNLLCAARFIAQTDFSGVAICMHESLGDNSCAILPACKSRKMHSSRRDAFMSVNSTPIAMVSEEITFLSPYIKKDSKRKLLLKTGMEPFVGIIRIHPSIKPETIDAYKKFRGVIMEGTGLGHAPAGKGNEKIFRAIERLAKNSVVAMSTQTIFGDVNMNVYSTGRKLEQAGVVPCHMTSEAAFIKLAWLIGNNPKAPVKKIAEFMQQDMRGEIF